MQHGGMYSDGAFDRAAERRHDEAWVRERLARPESRVFPYWRGRVLLAGEAQPRAAVLSPSALPAPTEPPLVLLLGVVDDVAHFAVDLSSLGEAPPALGEGGFRELRDCALDMARGEAALLAYARGLFLWHAGHRFCGVCGAPTTAGKAGHVRRCSNPDCRRQQFPRTDPAVITLVTRGERCLLARRRVWAENRRSTIAGFVEPGESLEDAVRREIREEVGVRVGRVDYRASQPWPFPASLMMGFRAEALDDAIAVDGDEIAEADWYDRARIRAEAATGHLVLPPADSISRQLVADWLDESA